MKKKLDITPFKEHEEDADLRVLSDEEIFLQAMEEIDEMTTRAPRIHKKSKPTPPPSRTPKSPPKPPPQSKVEEVGALAPLLFQRTHVSLKVMRQLKKGQLPIRDSLDLHGLTWKEAKEEIQEFLNHYAGKGQNCVLIIHGKAHGTVLGKATLKSMTNHLLKHTPKVEAFVSAKPQDGGFGAVYVLLR